MVKSPIKVIESGNVPTTENLGKGQVAFGQVGDSVKFYGSDGTTVTELNAGTQVNSVAPLMVETAPTISSGDNMKGSIAIGNSAQVSSPGTTVSGAVAIGDHAVVGSRGVSGIAIGRYANVPGNDIAIGSNARSVWDTTHSAGDSIVIGNGAKSDTTGANVGKNIAIGYGAVTKKRSSIAIGNGASADDYSICIGHTNYGEGASGSGSIAIGQSTDVPASGSICISSGSNAEVTGGGSILIGTGYLSSPSPSVGNSNVVAIGRNIVDNANSSVVIGAYATIDDNANGAVVIGSHSNATEPYTFSVGSGDATMNLTDDMDEETRERIQARAAAATRRIVNVTDPVNAQDAATKAYVDTKIAEIPAGTEVNTLSKTKTTGVLNFGENTDSLFYGYAMSGNPLDVSESIVGIGRVSNDEITSDNPLTVDGGIVVVPGAGGVTIGRGTISDNIVIGEPMADGMPGNGSNRVAIGTNMETVAMGEDAVAIGGGKAEGDNTVAIGRWSYTQSSDAFAVGRDDATYGSPEEFDESMARRIVGVKDPTQPHDAANKNYVDNAVAGKADASALDSYATKTELAAKADQTAVDTLTTTVNSKANQSDLAALQTTVTQQAETISQLQATITQLQTTIDSLTLKTEEIL